MKVYVISLARAADRRKFMKKQLDKLGEDRTDYSGRLTKTYSAMQTQLLKFKATQSYLEQQISVWSKSD